MTRKLLVPIDGSDHAWKALEFALNHHAQSDIVAYHVINDVSIAAEHSLSGLGPEVTETVIEEKEAFAKELAQEAEQRATEHGQAVETVTGRGLPGEKILSYIEQYSVDQVVMGSHGRSGLARIVLGSVAERVARHAPVPVTIVRQPTDVA